MRETIAYALMLVGCASIYTKPATYEAELVACNQTARTCAESIRCEDEVRARFGRPPRERRDCR